MFDYTTTIFCETICGSLCTFFSGWLVGILVSMIVIGLFSGKKLPEIKRGPVPHWGRK